MLAIDRVYNQDCLEGMRGMGANSIDAIVCDPPYGLSFMGQDWDHGVPGVPYWQEALRVAKPGAHLLAFGGTRTHHRLMVAIEDAGWEIRDCPLDLMRYLCRLVTPPGGLILDPFLGSGTTAVAAIHEGFHFLGFEIDSTYCADANRRIAAAQQDVSVPLEKRRTPGLKETPPSTTTTLATFGVRGG